MNRNLLLIAATLFIAAAPRFALKIMTINFDRDKVGALPKDFSTALTGSGKAGVWVVMKDEASPERKNVLAQTDADATSYRFPVCVYDQFSAKDLDLSVRFKPVSGRKDQAAGLVWRYRTRTTTTSSAPTRSKTTSCSTRWRTASVRTCRSKARGAPTVKTPKFRSGQWSTLRVTAAGNLFTVSLERRRSFMKWKT